jgi:hypothetical protein
MGRIRAGFIKSLRGELSQETFAQLMVPPLGQGQIAAWENQPRYASADLDSIRRLADFRRETVTELIEASGGELSPDEINRLMEFVDARLRSVRRVDQQGRDTDDRVLYRETFARVPAIEADKRAGNLDAATAAYDVCIAALRPIVVPRIHLDGKKNGKVADIETATLLFFLLTESLTWRMHAYMLTQQQAFADRQIFARHLADMEVIARDPRWCAIDPTTGKKASRYVESVEDNALPSNGKGRRQARQRHPDMGVVMAARLYVSRARFECIAGSAQDGIDYIQEAETYVQDPYIHDPHIELEIASLKAMLAVRLIPEDGDEDYDVLWELVWNKLKEATDTVRRLRAKTGDAVAEAHASAHALASSALADDDTWGWGEQVAELEKSLEKLRNMPEGHVPVMQVIEHYVGQIKQKMIEAEV